MSSREFYDDDSVLDSMLEDEEVSDFKHKFSRYELKKFRDPKKQALVEKIMRLPNAIYFDNEDIKKQIMTEFKDKDVVKLMMMWITRRMKFISEKASAFRDGILTRYSYLPPNKIMKKAKKYAKHLKFTQAEFELFRQMFMINYIPPIDSETIKIEEGENSGALARVFDVKIKEKDKGKLIYDPSEASTIENIIKAAKSSESLYYYTFIDSINYKDCDVDKYSTVPIKKNVKYTDCVHPVIAAMFMPKIPYFETRFIYQNIAKLVQMCYEHQKIEGIYKNLQYAMALDKSQYSDQTGHIITPIKDLQLRANIQIALWRIILMLRNNHVLDCDSTKLYNSLSVYAPDMFVDDTVSLNQNSIGIIRRLYNALSVSPLTITKKKLYSYEEKLKTEFNIKENEQVPFVVIRDGNTFRLQPRTVDKGKEYKKDEEREKESEKTSFIYVRPSSLNNTIENQINGTEGIKLGDTTYTTKYSSAEGVVTIIVLRTRNVTKKRWRYNGEIMTTLQNINSEFDEENINVPDKLAVGDKIFTLRSAVLSSSVKIDTDIKTNSDDREDIKSIKTRGSSYAIVFPASGERAITYHPYNINDYDPTTGQLIGPFNYIDRALADKYMGTQAEILIYANSFNGLTD